MLAGWLCSQAAQAGVTCAKAWTLDQFLCSAAMLCFEQQHKHMFVLLMRLGLFVVEDKGLDNTYIHTSVVMCCL